MIAPTELSDRKSLEKWLNELEPTYMHSLAIGTRAALRVLPLIFAIFEVPNERLAADDKKRAVLACFRAVLVAWVAGRNAKTSGGSLTRAALAAITAANKAADALADVHPSAFSAARAAGGAAATALANPFDPNEVFNTQAQRAGPAGFATATVEYAAKAVLNSEHMVWESVRADARWLEAHPSEALIEQELWLDDVRGNPEFETNFPIWAREPFDAIEKNPQFSWRGNWSPWLAWYRAILSKHDGSLPNSFGLGKDIEIASEPEGFWEGSPDDVMAKIAEILGLVKPRQYVEPQSDEPTANDQLGRKPFAQALVERMDRVIEKEGRDGFAVHIHGPWGAGKTSILKMMQSLMLKTDRELGNRKIARQWVVVDFNAWDEQRRNPPWWPLIEKVKNECLQSLSGSRGGWDFLRGFLKDLRLKGRQINLQPASLQAQWLLWKIRTDALPYIIFALVFAATLVLLRYAGGTGGTGSTGTTPSDWILKVFTAAIAAYASFFGASRVAVFGSAPNAKFYDDISQDPMRRITGLYAKIVKTTNKPVCIFIDDLDRCRAEYVVDLLEGIQTSFRHKNVAYVIAADRNWIKASFEMRYGSFANAIGSAGQPLGYLFLEKIFQVSTPVPGMGDKIKGEYWKRLLNAQEAAGASTAGGQFDKEVRSQRNTLRETYGENITSDDVEKALEKADTPELRAALALELTSSRAAEREAEHLLAQFKDVVPENPRVMKRMLNAFAMLQAIGILEGNAVPVEVLARWTILEQRFPALADLLIDHPEWTEILTRTIAAAEREKLPLLLPFLDLQIIQDLVGKTAKSRLTAANVLAITRGSAN